MESFFDRKSFFASELHWNLFRGFWVIGSNIAFRCKITFHIVSLWLIPMNFRWFFFQNAFFFQQNFKILSKLVKSRNQSQWNLMLANSMWECKRFRNYKSSISHCQTIITLQMETMYGKNGSCCKILNWTLLMFILLISALTYDRNFMRNRLHLDAISMECAVQTIHTVNKTN